ncbi:MAG: hypothetical protein ACRDZY_11710 [Acidimicrobiales bacterium]
MDERQGPELSVLSTVRMDGQEWVVHTITVHDRDMRATVDLEEVEHFGARMVALEAKIASDLAEIERLRLVERTRRR